jgi:hypothetical protein
MSVERTEDEIDNIHEKLTDALESNSCLTDYERGVLDCLQWLEDSDIDDFMEQGR